MRVGVVSTLEYCNVFAPLPGPLPEHAAGGFSVCFARFLAMRYVQQYNSVFRCNQSSKLVFSMDETCFGKVIPSHVTLALLLILPVSCCCLALL